MNRHKNLFTLIFIFALLFTACGGAYNAANDNMAYDVSENYNDVDESYDTADDTANDAIDMPVASESSGGLSIAQDASNDLEFNPAEVTISDRIIIKDATLELIVEDPSIHMDAIVNKTEFLGGFVVSTKLSSRKINDDLDIPIAHITIRVPSYYFASMISSVEEGVLEVTAKKITGKDITNAYTDMQSRLRNLESTAAQLELIMADASKTEDVLKVYRELQTINEEAEIIRGQLNYAKEASSFSMITIHLSAPIPPAPVVKQDMHGRDISQWGIMRIFESAKTSLLNLVQALVGFLIWLVVFFIPFVLMMGVPMLMLRWLYKKIRPLLDKAPQPQPERANRIIK